MRKPPNSPALKLVPPDVTTSPAPSALGEAGGNLWRSITSEYQITDSGGIAMLEQACLAADRAKECCDIIAADGAVISTKHGLKDHPLLRHELAARSFVVRTLARLGLDVEPVRPTVGRPPGRLGR